MSSVSNRSNAVVDSKNDNKKLLGSDIRLAEYALGADIAISKTGDIDISSEETNLAQAILHRLRTVKGELLDIGHSFYGSTLYDFIGEPNNEMTRSRLRMVVRDTLLQEPRIREIVNITIEGHNNAKSDETRQTIKTTELASISEANFIDGNDKNENQSAIASITQGPDLNNSLNALDIDITIIPAGGTLLPLNIVFPFYLEVT